MNEQVVTEYWATGDKRRSRILIGMDDGHAFRVRVPMTVRTVDAALEWLRPAGVPAAALRQGEFFFVPSTSPYLMTGEEYSDAGSYHETTIERDASFSRTHAATHCVALRKVGNVMFVGRRHVKSHSYTARPRYFVAGSVTHDEHGTLNLPAHTLATPGMVSWYEVVPNRAHGPFPVSGYGCGD